MNVNNLIIRPACADDITMMTDLLRELFSIEADFKFDAARQHRGLSMILEQPETRCIMVAESDGQVVGMCSVQMLVSTAEGGYSGLMEDLVVRLDCRDKGIGRKLVHAITQWCAAKGVTRLQLLADYENAPALRFYGKNGWRGTQMICLRKMIPYEETTKSPDMDG